ncbi:predicted protein [Naegleria gruberi]|uniref:Predicted protein n=1 Tax=Naegleria gruberi TaxID=5762 RepID=D2V2N9_NAEGR|nr:uncharacterized protein NAEGRDRAFT_30452 [Naegleria gruberi]EFC49096.1 predicted protein [Naegleria gruberi]|eukprot:XP_002681840.1 predicted protein [Naegleria gruberi strain NEG-M]
MDPFTIILIILAIIAIYSKTKKANAQQTTSQSALGLAIGDNYNSIEEVQDALRKTGLESCNLIIGIDYTKSNEEQGRKTFGGRSLHYIDPVGDIVNPYEKVISIIGRTLEKFDDDKLIDVLGFGDDKCRDFGCFPFCPNGEYRPCRGFEEVLHEYRRITPHIKLSGPTNFAPVIEKAIETVMQSGRGQYHILIILADGLVVNEKETEEAIVRASNYPISIVMVGLGDGPFDLMHNYDDELPQRKFDNFQFVHWDEVAKKAREAKKSVDATFALHALMEIPEQYSAIKKLGLVGKRRDDFNPNYVPNPNSGAYPTINVPKMY